MNMLLLADAPPATMIGVSLVGGLISVALAYAGRRAIVTKKAPARRLEKIWADGDGMIHGGMAVFKGYIMLIGGIVLTLMCIGGVSFGVYQLLFGS